MCIRDRICAVIDIPVIATVVRCDAVAHAKVKAGAKILNVAAGKDTPAVLSELREIYPNLPLIASGGRSSLSVRETVQAGDAVLLILLEVALEPIPVAGVLVGALPRQDVGGHAVEELSLIHI